MMLVGFLYFEVESLSCLMSFWLFVFLVIG